MKQAQTVQRKRTGKVLPLEIEVPLSLPGAPKRFDYLPPLTRQKINHSKLYKGLYIIGRRRRMPYNKEYF
jgi:hypothetical protein